MSEEEVMRLAEQGEALLEDERCEQALAIFERIISLAPMEPMGYMGKAQALIEMGRAGEGLAVLDAALEMQPEESVYLFTKGELLEGLGRYDEAQAAYQQAEEIGPPKHMGIFDEQDQEESAHLERSEEGQAALQHADKQYVLDPAIWFEQARTLEMLGHPEEALEVCEQVIADAPGWIVPWYKKVELLNALGRREEAERAARHIRALVKEKESAAPEDEPDELG